LIAQSKAPLENYEANVELIYRTCLLLQNNFIFVYMEILIVQPNSKKQLSAIKAVLKALDVSFKTKEESQYDPAFVDKILQGDEDFKVGKGKKVTLEELNSLWK
jgi:hypothetical protein